MGRAGLSFHGRPFVRWGSSHRVLMIVLMIVGRGRGCQRVVMGGSGAATEPRVRVTWIPACAGMTGGECGRAYLRRRAWMRLRIWVSDMVSPSVSCPCLFGFGWEGLAGACWRKAGVNNFIFLSFPPISARSGWHQIGGQRDRWLLSGGFQGFHIGRSCCAIFRSDFSENVKCPVGASLAGRRDWWAARNFCCRCIRHQS